MRGTIKLVLLIGLALPAGSCAEKERKLTKEEYRDIILDLQVAETIILNSTISNKDSLRFAYQQRISEIYGFKDIAALKQSLQPLESDPELMLDITKEMTKKLDQLEDSANLSFE